MSTAGRSVTGDDLRVARKERNLTQAQLAERVGCSESTIKQLEARGPDSIPIASRYVPTILKLLDLETAESTDGLLPADVVERALRQADDVALIAETARRMAWSRGVRHDQRNVAPFEVRGMPESHSSGRDTGDAPA